MFSVRSGVWLVIVSVIGGFVLYAASQRYFGDSGKEPSAEIRAINSTLNINKNMQLSSEDFGSNANIPAKYTCDGDDTNPSIRISNVPEQAKSLALIMDDPDAPAGTWDHWIVFNMSPSLAQIEERVEPAGVHGKGTSGNLEYHGPCPPSGEHRYFFKLYALDTMLALGEGASKQAVEKAMEGHVIEQAELLGKYRRG